VSASIVIRPTVLFTITVDHGLTLGVLVSAGRYGDAVGHFHHSIGVPEESVTAKRTTPERETIESVAPTLVCDCMISEATNPSMLRSVVVLTLVLDSEGSTENLTGWVARVASQLPRSSHRSLRGEWHGSTSCWHRR
jgi:hypothetical protein